MEIAKAGWLYRQSSILRRWKKRWFVLYVNGDLKYFESPDHFEPEDTVKMRVECLTIKTGKQCDVSPPEGAKKEALIAVHTNEDTWQLCGESLDDMKAWQFSLEQARVINHGPYYCGGAEPPPPYSVPASYPVQTSAQGYPVQPSAGGYPSQQVVYGYPDQRYYGRHPPPYVVQSAPGTTTVIYENDPRYRRGYDGTDVAMGMMAGAAIGSLMWSPLLFW